MSDSCGITDLGLYLTIARYDLEVDLPPVQEFLHRNDVFTGDYCIKKYRDNFLQENLSKSH